MGQAAQRTVEQSTGCCVSPLSEPHAQRARSARIPVSLQDLSMVFSFRREEGARSVPDERPLGPFCRGGIRISKALFRRQEEYEMDLWVVKYASRRSRIGIFRAIHRSEAQCSRSISNTRFSNRAQLMRTGTAAGGASASGCTRSRRPMGRRTPDPRFSHHRKTLESQGEGWALLGAPRILCRYITRPAIANDWLALHRAGQVVLALKTPLSRWHDAHGGGDVAA